MRLLKTHKLILCLLLLLALVIGVSVFDVHTEKAYARGRKMAEKLKLFIGGKFVESKTDRYTDAYNPSTGEDILTVPATISKGKCVIRLATRHTRDVPAGKYKWNLRLVSDPGRDEEGNIVADDDSDNVLSVFGPEKSTIPDFVVRRTGAYV